MGLLRQTVKYYQFVGEIRQFSQKTEGVSASLKLLIFVIPINKTSAVRVLDIGFGTGSLGKLIKLPQRLTTVKLTASMTMNQTVTTHH